jgi:hypothetical protein
MPLLRDSLSSIRPLVGLALLPLLVAACAGPGHEEQLPARGFVTEVAFQHSAKLGGCAVGELDPRVPGNEIAAVSVTGEVFVTTLMDEKWSSELVYRAGGEALQCAIGDVLPSRPGNELLVVGMKAGKEEDGGPGMAHVVYFDGQAWKGMPVHEEAALIHGCAIGEHGALLVGFTQQAILLAEQGGKLSEAARIPLPGNGKMAAAKGDSFVVACSDGSLLAIARESETSWLSRVLDKRSAGRARLAVSAAGSILCANDDGTLQLIHEERVTRQSQQGSTQVQRSELQRVERVVHRESAKLRGAAFGPFLPSPQGEHAGHGKRDGQGEGGAPSYPGPQLASVGYEGRLVVLLPDGEQHWRAQTLFRDLEHFHHLCAGTIGKRSERHLIACGYAGRVIVARWQR